MDKDKFKFSLMVLVLIISIASAIFSISENKKNKAQKIENTGKAMPKTEEKILKEGYKIVNNKKYSKAKKVNYRISRFFNSLNNEEINDMELFPDYIEFLGISSSDYLNLKYKYATENIFFYEILDIEEMKEYNKILVKTKHKYKYGESVIFKTFSIDDNYILDEPFLFVKDIKETVNFKDLNFFIDSKAIFNDKAIYKINIKNNGEEVFFIDEDIYSFYAAQDKNKYYHKMEFGDLTSYRIHPGTEQVLYVSFENLKGIADVYIKIGENDVLLTTN